MSFDVATFVSAGLAVGVPVLILALTIWYSQRAASADRAALVRQMEAQGARIDALNGRFDSLSGDLNGRFDSLSGDLNGRIDAVNADLVGRIDAVNADLSRQIEAQGRRIDALSDRIDALNDRVDALNDRVDALNDRFDALNGRVDALNGRVDMLNADLVGQIEAQSRRIDGLSARLDHLQPVAAAESSPTPAYAVAAPPEMPETRSTGDAPPAPAAAQPTSGGEGA